MIAFIALHWGSNHLVSSELYFVLTFIISLVSCNLVNANEIVLNQITRTDEDQQGKGCRKSCDGKGYNFDEC